MFEKKYECLTETRVSGLFQFERKFLKETEFFPDKTTLNFSENYTLMTEMESTKEKNLKQSISLTVKMKKNLIQLFVNL